MSYSKLITKSLPPGTFYELNKDTGATRKWSLQPSSYNDLIEGFKSPTEKRSKPLNLVMNPTNRSAAHHDNKYGIIKVITEYNSANWKTINTRYDTYLAYHPMYTIDDVYDWGPVYKEINSNFVNLSLYLATLRQSADLFVTCARSLIDIVKSITQPLRLLKNISAGHLLLDYGVAPTMGDLDTSLRNLAFGRQPFIKIDNQQRYNHYEDAESDSYHSIYNTTVTYKSTSYVELSIPGTTYWGGPLSTAWDLVPYSFVFDWFLPIADHLTAWDMYRRINQFKGTLSKQTVAYSLKKRKTTSILSSNTKTTYMGEKHSMRKSTMYSRTIQNFIPTPKLPPFKVGLSVGRCLNAASLLAVAAIK